MAFSGLVQYQDSSDDEDMEVSENGQTSSVNIIRSAHSTPKPSEEELKSQMEENALTRLINSADNSIDALSPSITNDNEVTTPKNGALIGKGTLRRYSCDSAVTFTMKLQEMNPDEFELPPEPEGRCSEDLQKKINQLIIKKNKENCSLNKMLQSRKDFRNPSIYDKLLLICKIDERGTNFPKDDFDPDFWNKQPTYEDLARKQREEYAKRDKEKKAKVEHVTATAKKSSSRPGSREPAKKSKWDNVGTDSHMLKSMPIPPVTTKYPFTVTTTSSSSKTSIPALGHLTKDKVRGK